VHIVLGELVVNLEIGSRLGQSGVGHDGRHDGRR
jgi:hypothetical protein